MKKCEVAASCAKPASLILAAAFAFQPSPAFADPKAGREIAAQKCQPCHGIDGVALIAEAPNLSGQNRAYLAKQIWAFRAGERGDEKMFAAVMALSDEDIGNLAEWYASITISVTLPD